ncbi:MAG: sigma-70 family RNA polymerase sigma factor [Nanobdellota archaeon]
MKEDNMDGLKLTERLTVRDEDNISKYFNEVRNYPLLNPDEETDLGWRARHGDERAREKLVLSNLRFVISVAKQYKRKGISFADLINEGNIGLIKAAERYDETKGFRFISYAVWWIRQTMTQYIERDTRTIRRPVNIGRRVREHNKERERMSQHYQSEVPEDIVSADYELRTRSIDEQMGDSEKTFGDYLEDRTFGDPESRFKHQSLKESLNFALDKLSEKNEKLAYAVRNFYGIGTEKLSKDSIAEDLGMSSERVRQYLKKGERFLKGFDGLREYL